MIHSGSRLADQCIECCRTLAGFTEVPGTTTRIFLCDSMRQCHAYLRARMEDLGMKVSVDNAGNLRAVYPALRSDAQRLVIGSHLDTVPNAGAYDGILGVAIGLFLIQALAGEKLPFEIELVGFSEEEGVRFNLPFIGSHAFVNTLDRSALARKDAAGISISEAIDVFGLDSSRLDDAVFNPRSFAYLEFHIEQGPVLQSIGQSLAVVDSIVGQSRATVAFQGQANHAGSTPMRFRRDALAAAAEWIGVVEAHARRTDGLVATVGNLEVPGSASNIIPGKTIASLDVRHADNDTRRSVFAHLLKAGKQIGARRNIDCSNEVYLDQGTVPMDPQLVARAEQSLRVFGVSAPRMSSGAGHDAMIIAPFLPSAMIFLRSPGGLSHHPDESVYPEDVAVALECGLHFLRTLGSTLPYE